MLKSNKKKKSPWIPPPGKTCHSSKITAKTVSIKFLCIKIFKKKLYSYKRENNSFTLNRKFSDLLIF